MPPRKRRQSAQGDEILKENEDRVVSPVSIGSESGKQLKTVPKTPDTNNQPERRLTARQQSKQDALQESQLLAGKVKDPHVPSAPAAESTAKQPTRFSTRIVKRPRRDLSPPESPVKKGKKIAATPTATTTPETKGKRQWELWSVEDKDSFFEGLCEFGKDFESIHTLIVNKCKKKGGVLPITVKNKEQVRHFYYRTWHKISKLIQPVEDLKKDIQELYGLISYSVLRKKLRGGVNSNDKNWQKLNDLVHQGVATIKVKGKRIRVKTPVCSALKKLNSYEEPKKDPSAKVPEKIRVEFRPKTNAAWQHVQDVSHNPRVRVTVRSDRHLQSLVKYLNQKWKPPRLKLRESLTDGEQAHEEFRVYPHHESTLRNISMEAVDEPVLQFCLNKHCKDNTYSPSTSKRKKEKETSVKTSSSVCTNTENSPDLVSKSVITEPCCACSDDCNNCAFKTVKSCGPSNDLVKSGASEDTVKSCSCLCNKDKILLLGSNKHSSDNGGGSIATEKDCFKDPPARSLFSAVTESSQSMKIPNDVGDIKCVLEQNESPKYRSDEVSLSSSMAFTVPELNAMVDEENAMFPDIIGNNFQEASSDVTVLENDSKVEQELEGNEFFRTSKDVNVKLSHEEKNCDRNTANTESSQANFEKLFKNMLDNGWGAKEGDDLTLAELYLMFGEEGELKFEYEWVSLRRETEILQEKLLINLNNMLRRLSHLAMIEFTDFTKSAGPNTSCQLCGQSPIPKKPHGRGKDKSPPGSSKAAKPGKDAATQTQGLRFNPIPIGPGITTSGQNGVFRIPVLPATANSQSKMITTVVTQPSKEQLARYNPTHNTTQKQLMRPRKLKPMSRSRPGTTGSLVQRTILPKNSEYITIIPMMPGTQIPNPSPEKITTTETIVGHPINGIQKHPITVVPSSPSVPVSVKNQVLLGSPSVTSSPSSNTASLMEMSLSPEGDQTLLRIPASHLATMSQEALKAAGLSAMPGTPISVPITVSTAPVFTSAGSYNSLTSTPVVSSKGSLSPPNLSALLDISLPTGEIETDTTFSEFLGDNKTLTLDPCLTTPPIRAITEHQPQKSVGLHSPPVRSLFQQSPTPEHQWLAGDVNDLSLSSFLDTPSRPATSSSSSMFNPNMPMSLFNENSRDYQSHRIDVDTTLQSMMNESSIDYVKKFADLAEQIVQNDTSHDHTKKPG